MMVRMLPSALAVVLVTALALALVTTFVLPRQAAADANRGTQTVKVTGSDLGGREYATATSAAIQLSDGVLSLTIRPAIVVPGQQIIIQGSGFVAGDRITSVSIGNQSAYVDATATSAGDIVFPVNVPSDHRGPGIGSGKKIVSVTAVGSGRVAEGSIEIPEPAITLDPPTSRRGTTVNVSGSGFPSGDLVQVNYDGRTVAADSADAYGAVSIDFTVPSYARIGATHNIEATSVGRFKGVTARATHETPASVVTLSSDTVSPGEYVTISGMNFPAFATVAEMTIGGVDVRPNPAPATSIDGDFQSTVLVPLLEPGNHTVSIRVSQTTVTAFLKIDASVPVPPAPDTTAATVTLSSDTASSGQSITIIGRNFPAFNNVAVITIGSVDVRPVPSPATSIDGHFEAPVLVPQLELGFQIVWVRVGQITATTLLEIVASAPQASEHSATRSFSATTVAPGGELTVNITLGDYGEGGSLTEALPPGFTFVSGSVQWTGGGGFVHRTSNEVGIVLSDSRTTNVSYKVTAPSQAGGPYIFIGKFVNFGGQSVNIGGASTVTVTTGDPLVVKYDKNEDGEIDPVELSLAISDYLAGLIEPGELSTIIALYLSGPD